MASFAQLASIGLIAGRPLIDNSDVIYDKAKDRVSKAKARRKSTTRVYEEKKSERKKDDRRDDDDDGPPRPRGGSGARARSVGLYEANYSDEDEDYYRRSRARDRGQNRRKSGYDDEYDSEGSIPPRNRQQMVRAQGGNQTMAQYGSSRYANSRPPATTKSENDRGSSSDSDDSTSTDDLMDSEEDERQEKKKRRNEMLTGGIAAVATLNAAANVYNSMKARELRIKELAEGTITQEEAKKQRYKHHMQDAATIGLAALTVKGAYAKWQGTVSKHKETLAHKEERKRRQEKRIQKGISRKNDERERAAAAARGRMAPGYEETARQNRPGYNRQYSREYEDLPSPGYEQDPYYAKQSKQRSYGRSRRENGPYGGPGQRGHDSMDTYNGADAALAGYSHDA